PATLSEWISYHIRGVISLRKGDLDAALKIFEWGSRENPWINNKASFETALAGVKLRQAQYKQATDLHHQNFDPAVKPIAQIFQLHAYSKLRDVKKATLTFKTLLERCPPILRPVRDELGVQCGLLSRNTTPKSDQWLFDQESNSLLLA